jgi:hypothetical protein
MFRVSAVSGAICHIEGMARKLLSACVVLVEDLTVIGTSVTVEYTKLPTVRAYFRYPYIAPEATATDSAASDDVWTNTPTAPEVIAPIVSPVIVSATADAAGIAAPDIVIVSEVAVVKLQVPASFAILLWPDEKVGFIPEAKNPDG